MSKLNHPGDVLPPSLLSKLHAVYDAGQSVSAAVESLRRAVDAPPEQLWSRCQALGKRVAALEAARSGLEAGLQSWLSSRKED